MTIIRIDDELDTGFSEFIKEFIGSCFVLIVVIGLKINKLIIF